MSTFVPIQGEATIQITNDLDTYGGKNAVRTMSWEAMTTTGAEWSGTVAELKSLESEDALLSSGNTPYTADQTIKVVEVDVQHLKKNAQDIWSVSLSYMHR